jgi:Icc-related predicted phosphoesterase
MKEIKFTLFTDVHYNPQEKGNSPKGIDGKSSVKEFPRFIQKLKKQKNDFLINIGDLFESGTKKELRLILNSLNELPYPVFHTLGNHELDVMNISELKKMFKIKSWSYISDFEDYRMIFLNGFDRKSTKTDGRRPSRISGGSISIKQLNWFKRMLKTSKKVIVFTHKPLIDVKLKKNPILLEAPERYRQIENPSEILNLIKNSKNVIVVFQGHLHQNSIISINGVPFINIQAFCQNKKYVGGSKSDKSYAIIKISDKKIMINIKGDKKKIEVKLR